MSFPASSGSPLLWSYFAPDTPTPWLLLERSGRAHLAPFAPALLVWNVLPLDTGVTKFPFHLRLTHFALKEAYTDPPFYPLNPVFQHRKPPPELCSFLWVSPSNTGCRSLSVVLVGAVRLLDRTAHDGRTSSLFSLVPLQSWHRAGPGAEECLVNTCRMRT